MNGYFLEETNRGYERIGAESRLLNSRKLFFIEEVNRESANALITYLLGLEAEDDEAEITICINSPGGEVDSGLAVYDVIRSLACPVRTICTGTAASMASIIFLAGDKREMLPHTKLMIHDPLISGISGSVKALEFEKKAKDLLSTRKTLAGIIAERSGKSIEDVYEKTIEDCYLNVEEAIEFGLATGLAERI